MMIHSFFFSLPPLQSGTTFLFDELLRHPHILARAPNSSSSRWNEVKEPQYWNGVHLRR